MLVLLVLLVILLLVSPLMQLTWRSKAWLSLRPRSSVE
jgi:hypothetical protein